MDFIEKVEKFRKELNFTIDEMIEVYGSTKCILEMEYKIEPYFKSKKKTKKVNEFIEKKAQEAAQKFYMQKVMDTAFTN